MNRKHFIAVFCMLFACLLSLFPVTVAAESSTSVSTSEMNVKQVLRDDATGQEFRNTLFDGSYGGIIPSGYRVPTMSVAPGGLNWNDLDTIHFDINIASGSGSTHGMNYDKALYTVEFVYYNDKSPLDYSKFKEAFYYHAGDYKSTIEKQDVYVGLVDTDKYPNPFLNVSDEQYAAYARVVRFTFDNSIYSDGTIYCKWAFSSATSDAMAYGLGYFDVYVTYDEAEIYWLSEVYRQTTNVLSQVRDIYRELDVIADSLGDIGSGVTSLLSDFNSYSSTVLRFLNVQIRQYLSLITNNTGQLVNDGRSEIAPGYYTVSGKLYNRAGFGLPFDLTRKKIQYIDTTGGDEVTRLELYFNFESGSLTSGEQVDFNFLGYFELYTYFNFEKASASLLCGNDYQQLQLNKDFKISQDYVPYAYLSADESSTTMESSWMVEGSFTPTSDSATLTISIPMSGVPAAASPAVGVGYAEAEFYTTYNVKILSGIASLITTMNNAFNMSGDDESDFDQMEQQAQDKVQQSQDKLDQNKQELEDQKQENDKQNEVVQQQQQQVQQSEKVEQEFKGEYVEKENLSDVSSSLQNEYTEIYGISFLWWKEAFETFIGFQPIKTMLYTTAFFGLLMVLLNSGIRHAAMGERRSRMELREVKRGRATR